jgi:hypothetical protein
MPNESDDVKKIVERTALTLMAAIVVFTVINNITHHRKMSQGSVFVLGIVTQKESGKNSTSYTGNYVFKGKQYPAQFNSLAVQLHLGEYFFIRIASADPETADYLYDEPVPACLTPASMPAEGWKTLPSYCDNPCAVPIKFADLQKYRFKNRLVDVGLINSYSFHTACGLRKDTVFANVFKCLEPDAKDTILVFSLCRSLDDFSVPPYEGRRLLTLDSNSVLKDHPAEVVTSMDKGSISTNYKYLIVTQKPW